MGGGCNNSVQVLCLLHVKRAIIGVFSMCEVLGQPAVTARNAVSFKLL